MKQKKNTLLFAILIMTSTISVSANNKEKAEDGRYPINPYELGKKVPIPQGDVNFPVIVSCLKHANYKDNITIEFKLPCKRNIIETGKTKDKGFILSTRAPLTRPLSQISTY